ncbi:MAG: hypothetical protein ACOCRX_10425 [Candidatus Woesearchaeota archaeon]
MNFKTAGYYILIISLILLIGNGIYRLLETIIFDYSLSIFYKIVLTGIIIGVLFILTGLIIERIREEKKK